MCGASLRRGVCQFLKDFAQVGRGLFSRFLQGTRRGGVKYDLFVGLHVVPKRRRLGSEQVEKDLGVGRQILLTRFVEKSAAE